MRHTALGVGEVVPSNAVVSRAERRRGRTIGSTRVSRKRWLSVSSLHKGLCGGNVSSSPPPACKRPPLKNSFIGRSVLVVPVGQATDRRPPVVFGRVPGVCTRPVRDIVREVSLRGPLEVVAQPAALPVPQVGYRDEYQHRQEDSDQNAGYGVEAMRRPSRDRGSDSGQPSGVVAASIAAASATTATPATARTAPYARASSVRVVPKTVPTPTPTALIVSVMETA